MKPEARRARPGSGVESAGAAAATSAGAVPGYAECHYCTVPAKRLARRCRRCVGRLDLRERLRREAETGPRRRAGTVLSLLFPGLGHAWAAHPGTGMFFLGVFAVCLGYLAWIEGEMNAGRYFTLGSLALIWVLAALDASRGQAEPTPPCQEACPAGLSCMHYVQHVREGRHRESLEQIQLRCPLPASIGRICHHPCEADCRRGREGDPIAICALKRFVADRHHGDLADFYRGAAPAEPAFRERVAVVGAGPSGLSAALVLRIMGFGVTVFEAESFAGGMPAIAIPSYRLPADIYRREVEAVLAAGVELRKGMRLGTDFQLADLQAEGFAGAYLALGAQRTVRLPHCGTAEEGFIDGLQFLRESKLGTAQRLSGEVLVIGGGNVAMDVAKTALRLGAVSVRTIFLETRESMPAHRWECEEALEEGVMLIPASATVAFERRDGRVVSARCKRVERIEVEPGGRIRPVLWEGTDFDLPASTVITAVGSGPDFGFLPAPPPRVPLRRGGSIGRLPAAPGITIPVFFGGDFLTGPASVIRAIAAGYQAAGELYRALGKVRHFRLPHWNRMRRVRFTGYSDTPELRTRSPISAEDPRERCASFCEICQVFPEDRARREAERCLRCRWNIAKPAKAPRRAAAARPAAGDSSAAR